MFVVFFALLATSVSISGGMTLTGGLNDVIVVKKKNGTILATPFDGSAERVEPGTKCDVFVGSTSVGKVVSSSLKGRLVKSKLTGETLDMARAVASNSDLNIAEGTTKSTVICGGSFLNFNVTYVDEQARIQRNEPLPKIILAYVRGTLEATKHTRIKLAHGQIKAMENEERKTGAVPVHFTGNHMQHNARFRNRLKRGTVQHRNVLGTEDNGASLHPGSVFGIPNDMDEDDEKVAEYYKSILSVIKDYVITVYYDESVVHAGEIFKDLVKEGRVEVIDETYSGQYHVVGAGAGEDRYAPVFNGVKLLAEIDHHDQRVVSEQ